MTPADLRSELERRGLSVRGAAALLRLDPSYLWRLMIGQRPITDDRADLIRMRLSEYDQQS